MKTPSLIAVLSLTAASAALGAPFQNGSFEIGPDPGNATPHSSGSTSITGWTVTADDIDYIGTYWTSAAGSRSLDMAGSGAGTGAIAQTFDTVAGHNYQVTFALAGNPDGSVKTMLVSATGGTPATYTFDTSGHSTTSMGWTTQTYSFTAAGASTTLTFSSQNGGVAGPALDDVQVMDLTPSTSVVAVPTLSEWSLLALSAVLAGLAMRRRKAG